jgi:imidazolonepropionase-like amidohydrolase
MKWIALAVFSIASLASADDATTFLIRGATVHPVASPEIDNGSVLVRDGKIVGIGRNLTAPKGIKIIEAKGLHVYPGMIDSGTQMGLSEIESTRESVDTGELGKYTPQLRAEIAINPDSEHISVTRVNGITSVISLPLSGGGEGGGGRRGTPPPSTIAGQAALVHLDGWTWEDMDIKKSAGMALRMPIIAPPGGRGGGPDAAPRLTYSEAKKNYDADLRDLHEFFQQVRRYQKAKAANGKDFHSDLKMEAMLPVIEGKEPLIVFATRERAIRDAVQFADQEKVRAIIANPRELGKMGPELKARNIPAILGPTLELPLRDDDPYDAAYTLPSQFFKAGVNFAFGSFDNQFSRDLPYQAATAVAFGLPYDEALKAVTINAAQIWGVADKTGSIEEGKWADLMITDGDPLEAKTNVKQVFIKGKNIDLDNKQKRLYEKYLGRP